MIVSLIPNLWMAVALISLAAAGHQGWASNLFTIVSDIYPKNTIGSMMGLTGFAGAIGGTFSASFVGLILETTGSCFLIFFCCFFGLFNQLAHFEFFNQGNSTTGYGNV